MKTYKYWTMILAIGAAMAAPLYGCSSDDVETNKGGNKNAGGSGGDDSNGDGGSGGDDSNGDGGSGGEGGSGGDGGDGGNGGEGGSGGNPGTTCNFQFQGDTAGTCSACGNANCCDELMACDQGTPCAALMACIDANKCTTQDCITANCAAEIQAGGNDYNALGACMCQGSCGAECAGVVCQ